MASIPQAGMLYGGVYQNGYREGHGKGTGDAPRRVAAQTADAANMRAARRTSLLNMTATWRKVREKDGASARVDTSAVYALLDRVMRTIAKP